MLQLNEDDTLHIAECNLQNDFPPVSTLMNSSHQYRKLHLGQDIKSENPELAKRFFEDLGQHIHELNMIFSVYCKSLALLQEPDFLLLFPKMRSLHVDSMKRLKKFQEFPEFLEHIRIEELSIEKMPRVLDYLNKNISNLKSLSTDMLSLQLSLMDDPALTRFFSSDDSCDRVLTSIQEYSVWIKVSTNFAANPVIKLDDVTEFITEDGHVLAEGFRKPTDTEHFSFSLFPNLTSIELKWDKDSYAPTNNAGVTCYRAHETVLCPKVNHLEFESLIYLCMGCWRNIIDSLPNLTKLSLLDNEFSIFQIKYIFYKLPQLKQLAVEDMIIHKSIYTNDRKEYLLGNLSQLESLSLPRSRISTSCTSDGEWPELPKLIELDLGILEMESLNDLKNFLRKMPKLVEFKISNQLLEDCTIPDYFCEALADIYPNLERIDIFFCQYNLSKEGNAAIKTQCKKLKKLFLWNTKMEIDKAYDFFSEIPSLEAMRVDGYEMCRNDYKNIADYLKRNKIPYDSIGTLKDIVEEYSLKVIESNGSAIIKKPKSLKKN